MKTIVKNVGFAMALNLLASVALAESGTCSATDAVTNTAFGAGVGAVAGVASVWTIGILAAPFTLGSSLVASAGMTLPALSLGAQGGAFYGAATEAIDCGKVGTKKLLGDDPRGN